MNYKVMTRPMFRLGGSARKNYQNGTDLSDIEKLIEKRAGLRDKALGSMRTMLPLSVLASEMPNIRTIRKPGDILEILSNIGGSEQLMGALAKLPAIDLKQSEGELTDKITLAKLRNKMAGSSTRLKSEAAIRRIETKIIDLENEKKVLEGKEGPEVANRIEKINTDLRIEKQSLKAFINENLRLRAIDDLSDNLLPGERLKEEDIERRIRLYQGADGGRVGYQQGTPNPMVMPEPKPQEAVQDRKLDTLMDAAPALEDPNEAKSMGEKDMYNALRRRLPKEISDDVVRLIAYNQEAFADFANISDQSDVESFNQKYNVELVLPVGNQ
jgi:hypothetical protein